MQSRSYFVYILASKKHGTLYVGVTHDLAKRVYEHRSSSVAGFTKDHAIHQLVYYKETTNIASAIEREKRLKNGIALGKFVSLKNKTLHGMIYLRSF